MNDYPQDWDDISRRIKDAAGWKCERCKHDHDPQSGHILTTHHLDGNKANCEDWNLAALCQRCHLEYDREHHRETRQDRKDRERPLLEVPHA